jgi:DHA2 family multidrug resistance protein-like MFS transporter
VAFIRVGEKLLQRFGARKPMIWGSLIGGASILLLMPTYLLLDTCKILAVVAFSLFGIALAFYATPSTDAALANLPDDQAALFAFGANLLMVVAAIIAIMVTVPRGKSREEQHA